MAKLSPPCPSNRRVLSAQHKLPVSSSPTEISRLAVLAVNAGAANAQDTATPSADPASGTVYAGDVIQGKKVVSTLDVNDLEPGKKHLLYFQGAQMPTGQHWYVSVMVAKGTKPGKRAILVSGVHGDEMSSVHTVQTVMNQLTRGDRHVK